jgi:hypothetical protein
MTTTDAEPVENLIVTIRRQRVILSADLARIYGVPTKVLNQAIRRNAERFPHDFVLRISRAEADRIGRSRSQSVTLKRGSNVKYAPLAFTEHGAIMAATVLNSARAVQMSIFVVRAFLRLRQWVAGQAELATQLARLERRVGGHDHELQEIVTALRQLLDPVEPPRRPRIGFTRGEEA